MNQPWKEEEGATDTVGAKRIKFLDAPYREFSIDEKLFAQQQPPTLDSLGFSYVYCVNLEIIEI